MSVCHIYELFSDAFRISVVIFILLWVSSHEDCVSITSQSAFLWQQKTFVLGLLCVYAYYL